METERGKMEKKEREENTQLASGKMLIDVKKLQ